MKSAMRKIVFMLASAMMLFACQKAVTDSTSATDKPDDKVVVGTVTLKALLPGFNDETKAGISDAGVFSWVDGENADVIAVRYTKAGEEDEYVEFTCTDASECEFTGEPSDGYSIATSGNIAFYPKDYRGTPSAFSGSADDAPKSFQMKASSIEEGKLIFEHDNALLKLAINNIPSIADNIVIGYKSGYSTVNLSEGGDLDVMVPAIASDAGNLHIYVKRGDQVLFTKGTSKGVEIKKGYLYTRIPTLSVAPEAVYLKSSMTDWSDDTSDVTGWASMTKDGDKYVLSLNSIGNEFATVYVKWHDGIVKMGPETDQSTTESQVFVPASHAIKLATLGAYDFAFDPVTSEFSFEKTAGLFTFYVFGSENEWSLTDTSMPLKNKTADDKFFLIGQKGQYKIRYNCFEKSSFGYGTSNSGSTGVNVFGPSETGSSSVIINIPNDGSGVTYNYYNENYQSTESHSSVYVKINNSDDGLPMVQDTYNKSLWTYIYDATSTHYVTFWVDALWDTGEALASTEYNGVGATYNNYYGVGNWCIGKMTYLIVLNDNTGKLKFLKTPNGLADFSIISSGDIEWD